MASDTYHEDELSEDTRDLHRAIRSLMEELEAVDWYQQRVDATSDTELAAVLAHNRDEEIEHAMMVLEWLRRKMPKFDEEARTYLFSRGPITEVEAHATEGGGPVSERGELRGGGGEASEARELAPAASGDGSLRIGSLRGRR
jgi:uncharacterized protein